MANVMLSKNINPIKVAENNQTLEGTLDLAEMTRLAEISLDKEGIAAINFESGQDAEGYYYISGEINTEFKLICQRCNKPMLLKLAIAVNLSPVFSDEQAQQLPKIYDPLLLSGDTVNLSTMVEEEILLSIPVFPKHSLEECPVNESHLREWEEEDKDNITPFAVLKKLLRE